MRLFIGIALPKKIKRKIFSRMSKLRKQCPQVKWEKEEKLHITLKFLGAVKIKKCRPKDDQPLAEKIGNNKISEIQRAIEKAVKDFQPFEITIKGFGYFSGHALVVWVGVEDESGRLEKIAKNLNKQMAKLGFKREKRKFHGHITLARVKQKSFNQWDRLRENIKKLDHEVMGSFEVDKITLFESRLSRKGSEYRIIEDMGIIRN